MRYLVTFFFGILGGLALAFLLVHYYVNIYDSKQSALVSEQYELQEANRNFIQKFCEDFNYENVEQDIFELISFYLRDQFSLGVGGAPSKNLALNFGRLMFIYDGRSDLEKAEIAYHYFKIFSELNGSSSKDEVSYETSIDYIRENRTKVCDLNNKYVNQHKR